MNYIFFICKTMEPPAAPPTAPPTSISWPSPPLPVWGYKILQRIVSADTDYYIDKVDDLTDRYKAVTAEYPEYTPYVIFNLRSNLLKDKIVKSHWRIAGLKAEILRLYQVKPITTLSHVFDYPPLCLMRSILDWKYPPNGSSIVKDVIKGLSVDHLVDTVYDSRDIEQVKLAYAVDAEHDPEAANKLALRREDRFIKLLSCIPHQTESGLRDEQAATHGRATATPDILFDQPVMINGVLVKWIDYKSYVGAPDTFLAKKLREQAKKYNQRFGPGAFAFRRGFVEGTTLDALLLNADTIPEICHPYGTEPEPLDDPEMPDLLPVAVESQTARSQPVESQPAENRLAESHPPDDQHARVSPSSQSPPQQKIRIRVLLPSRELPCGTQESH